MNNQSEFDSFKVKMSFELRFELYFSSKMSFQF